MPNPEMTLFHRALVAKHTTKGGEEPQCYESNSMLNIGNIGNVRLRYAWKKISVFLHGCNRWPMDRCVLYAYYGKPG
jgi:hypothetical protein